MIYTCPHGVAYAVPDHYAGRICLCLTPGAAGAPAPSPTAGSHVAPQGAATGDGPAPASSARSVSGGGGRPGQPGGSQSRLGPIEATAKPDGLEGDWKPDRDLLERAEAWFKTKFYKPKGIGDEWRTILGACKTWGMPPDEKKWRDWLKTQWETARANCVRILITSGEIKAPELSTQTVAGTKALPPGMMKALEALQRAAKEKAGSGVLVATEDDWRAEYAALEAKTITMLLDGGFIYEPLVGKYARIVEASK